MLDPLGRRYSPILTSVVDLKFPSFRWQPRWGTSNPNHTRFNVLLVCFRIRNSPKAKPEIQRISDSAHQFAGGAAPGYSCHSDAPTQGARGGLPDDADPTGGVLRDRRAGIAVGHDCRARRRPDQD